MSCLFLFKYPQNVHLDFFYVHHLYLKSDQSAATASATKTFYLWLLFQSIHSFMWDIYSLVFLV